MLGIVLGIIVGDLLGRVLKGRNLIVPPYGWLWPVFLVCHQLIVFGLRSLSGHTPQPTRPVEALRYE